MSPVAPPRPSVSAQLAAGEWDESKVRALSLLAGEPVSVLDLRLEALRRLATTPLPNAMDESWRRTDPTEIGMRRFRVWEGGREPSSDYLSFGDLPAGAVRLDLFNARPAIPAPGSDDLKGAFLGAWGDAFRIQPHIVEVLRSTPDDADSPALTLLNLAFAHGGTVLVVPDGVELEPLVHIRHRIDTPGAALFPAHIISIGAESRARAVVDTSVAGAEGSWCGGMTRIEVAEGGRLDLVVLSRAGAQCRFYDHLSVRLADEAKLCLTWADLTDGWAVLRREVFLNGQGSEARLQGVHLGAASSHYDLRTVQRHAGAASGSNLLHKVALFGRAQAIFQGLIYVAPDAVNANAYQLNRNLLMDPQTRADSIPKLEIAVDEVRCSHGVSSGKLDPDALFYLMSRGLSRRAAVRLQVEGFLREAGERLDEDTSGLWRRAVDERLDEVLN